MKKTFLAAVACVALLPVGAMAGDKGHQIENETHKLVNDVRGSVKGLHYSRLEAVYFDFGSASVRPEGFESIENVAEFVRGPWFDQKTVFDYDRNAVTNLQRSEHLIILRGFADTVSSPSYNKALSKRRVDAVASALIADGVNPANIVRDYYGENRLAVETRDSVKEQANRRVELETVFRANHTKAFDNHTLCFNNDDTRYYQIGYNGNPKGRVRVQK